ncbi:MAG TPA: prepilin-type N-terminal cleavage/methylation domain-containing protein [Caldimonas sp.]|jgi:Tfp pilus assembly protein PilV
MASPRTSSASRSRQRGVTLLESLVAFFVLAAGSVAVAQWQGHLRLATDVARERSEAVRIGEEALEDLRSFAVIDGAPGVRTYAAIASGVAVVAAASGAAHTAYRVERIVDEAAFADVKAATLAIRWSDRSGTPREAVLHAFVAAHDPAYAASLAIDVGTVAAATRGVGDRRPGLPLTAKSLDGGRSAWKPIENGSTAWVFDDRSGAVVSVCDAIAASTSTRDLTADALRSCASGHWLLVAGTVRVATTAPAAAASLAPSSTVLRVDLRDGSYPAPASCFGEAKKTVRYVVDGSLRIEDVAAGTTAADAGVAAWDETGDRFLAWHCIVAPRADGRWSGRIVLVATGWTIGAGDGEGRVCRLAASDDRAAIDANIASAGVDLDVDTALLGRSFLVVRGSDPCPHTPPAEQHQP